MNTITAYKYFAGRMHATGSAAAIIFFGCFIAAAVNNTAKAQNRKTDSMRMQLQLLTNEKDKLNYYCDLGWEWYTMNTDTAITYATKGLQVAMEIGSKSELACNYNVLGLSYFNKRLNRKSLDYYLKGLVLYKELGDNRNVARISMNIVDIYMNLNNYEEALQYSLAGLYQAEKDKDSILISSIHRSVSIVYRTMDNYKKAEEHVLKSLAYAGASGNTQTKGKSPLGAAYSSYGILLRLMKRYDSSVLFTKKSIEIYSGSHDDFNKALGLENLAEIYFDTKQVKTAIQYYNAAMQIFIEMESPVDVAYELNNIAKCENALGHYSSALAHLEKAQQIFIENAKDEYLMDAQRLMYETYQSLGNTEKAFEYYKKYVTIKDTILNQEQRNKLMQLQTEYETVENEKKIAALNTEKLLQEEKLKRNSLTTVIMAVVIGLMIFTGFVLYNRYKLKQQLKEVEMRNKIAGDLHDDVGATLSSISMYSNIVSSQLKDTNPRSVALLDKISNNSKEMIENMSDIVWMIKPGNDDFKTIENRMLNFANELCVPAGIQFAFLKDNAVDDIKMPMQQRRDLYLIFKEAVNNAVKYSGCSLIKVSITKQDHQLKMNIADNGKGFDTNSIKKGNGLDNMKTRTATYSGIFNIESFAGSGTQIEVCFTV